MLNDFKIEQMGNNVIHWNFTKIVRIGSSSSSREIFAAIMAPLYGEDRILSDDVKMTSNMVEYLLNARK